jgi:hypothetical protein
VYVFLCLSLVIDGTLIILYVSSTSIFAHALLACTLHGLEYPSLNGCLDQSGILQYSKTGVHPVLVISLVLRFLCCISFPFAVNILSRMYSLLFPSQLHCSYMKLTRCKLQTVTNVPRRKRPISPDSSTELQTGEKKLKPLAVPPTPLVPRRVQADLDSDDELMMRLHNQGLSPSQISKIFQKQGRNYYKQKSISSRIRRIGIVLHNELERKAETTNQMFDDHDVRIPQILCLYRANTTIEL